MLNWRLSPYFTGMEANGATGIAYACMEWGASGTMAGAIIVSADREHVGRFPLTQEGRVDAQAACERWEMEKARVW